VAGLDTSSALGAFEKMEEKVMALEAQAEAAQMVSGLLCRAGLLR
jgi:phage shock protein A